jgi:hypothetical protein
MCADFPVIASNINRLWARGFYTAETDKLLFEIIKNCANLTCLSIPWTMVRTHDSTAWDIMLTGQKYPLESLELHCIDLSCRQRLELDPQVKINPLKTANFNSVRRLKVFGDSTYKPLTDDDLFAIACSATSLEEFHLTCNSSITIEGVMSIVKSSCRTIRVIEHSPRSMGGFRHSHPGHGRKGEHVCRIISDCPKIETFSMSLPSVCKGLFLGQKTRYKGNLQVRTLSLCDSDNEGPKMGAADLLVELLDEARCVIDRCRSSTLSHDLYIEIFFAGYIFEPSTRTVHGDMNAPILSSDCPWLQDIRPSRKGPYGSTGFYGKEMGHGFSSMSEAVFLQSMSIFLSEK